MPKSGDAEKALLLKRGLYLNSQAPLEPRAVPSVGLLATVRPGRLTADWELPLPLPLPLEAQQNIGRGGGAAAEWTKVLASMQANPEGDEFVYLKQAWPDALPLNPFDLQICSHAEARQQPFYFTMSPAGVTTYADYGTPLEFVSLKAWQREHFLHKHLMQLMVFRHYRLWKGLAIWRRAVRYSKAVNCAEVLNRDLYTMNPALQAAIRTVRLRRSSAADSENSPSPSSKHHAGGPAGSSTTAARSAHGLVAAEPVHLLSDSYALLAARRTLKRRLYLFVRLLDYMVADAVHAMVSSIQTLTYIAQDQELLQRVAIRADVVLDQQQDVLLVKPGGADITQGLDNWLQGIGQVVRSITCLTRHSQLKALVEATNSNLENPNPEGLTPIMLGSEYELQCEALLSLVQQSQEEADRCAASLAAFRDMVVANRQFDEGAIKKAVLAGALGLPGLKELLVGYRQQLQDVKALPPAVPAGVLYLQLHRLVSVLAPSPQRCLDGLHRLLPTLAASAHSQFINKVRDYKDQLCQQPTSAEEFVAHLHLIEEVEAQRPQLDKEFALVSDYYALLREFNVPTPDEDVASVSFMDADYAALRDAAWAAESTRDGRAQAFLAQLQHATEQLNKKVAELRSAEQDVKFLQDNDDIDAIISATSELMAQVAMHQAAARQLSSLAEHCGGTPVVMHDLDALAADVELKHTLWTAQQDWANATVSWLQAPFFQLDVLHMQDEVDRLMRQAHRLERGLTVNPLVPQLKDSLARWQELLGPVTHLHNQHLRERHWAAIEDLLGRRVDRTPDAVTSIASLLDLQLLEHQDQISVISSEATQEAALEALLAHVADRWRGVEFLVKPWKDLKAVYILGEVDDVVQVLEDSKVTLSMIQASRHVSGIKSEVDRFDQQLKMLSGTLDAWLQVQKGWLALEAVFAAPDIQRQVPAEAAAFAQVDRTFKDIMRCTHDRPNALQCGTTPGWWEALVKCAQTLEEVQKGLEDYLEAKRVAFPRFYFLSNEELLDILRQAKIPQAVQPHLPKCFDGIQQLEFAAESTESHGPQKDILAMLSADGERVPFGRTLKVTWVLAQPAQLALLVSSVFWCQAVEEAFSAVDNAQELLQLHARCVIQLEELTALVRGPLSNLERKSVVALITTDVHHRDIVAELSAHSTTSVQDFAWQRQLRFEYDMDSDNVVVRQLFARFDYGYEYLGAQPRLVVTPMTDRCHLTLTGALALRLGGAPAGPAGTGKTETVRDLGKALGVQCVVFNCSEGLDFKFNRIELEVLSVVAQQLLALQAALKSGAERFLFEGHEMALVRTCGVFITMNPGYAGRTELPDNLKVLFRPVAMVVPDYQLVAEVILFSEGFDKATWLARKIVTLYRLASEQLSQQSHYDFGMRSLKAVLVMAGSRRCASPDLPEEFVLIRAMKDANIPKLLSEDIMLFEAILSDLFPGVQLPNQVQQALPRAVRAACTDLGLQPVDSFINKVLELHHTLEVRFGVMLIGPAGGGKSSSYRVLQAAQTALGRMDQQRQSDQDHCREQVLQPEGILPEAQYEQSPVSSGHDCRLFQVHAHVLAPQAVSLSELYGSYSPVTHDWTDGLASSIVRAAVADASSNMHWVMFDGPVDPSWIESMNTVLDDNRLLCLSNGERIKLDEQRLRMMFEVEDLAHASPATVSRCGMVYMPADVVGWRPMMYSCLSRLLSEWSTAAGADSSSTPQEATAAVLEPPEAATSSSVLADVIKNGEAKLAPATGTIKSTTHSRSRSPVSDTAHTVNDASLPDKLQPSAGRPAAANRGSSTSTSKGHLDEGAVVTNFIWTLFDNLMEPLLQWVQQYGTTLLPTSSSCLAKGVMTIFESQAAAFREPGLFNGELTERQQQLLQHLIVFAVIWGIGGCLSSSCWPQFDQEMRRLLFQASANLSLPLTDASGHSKTVFDYHIHVMKHMVRFSSWDHLVAPFEFDLGLPSHVLMVPTVDTVRYGCLLQGCLRSGLPLLLVGPASCGKTVIIKAGIAAHSKASAGRVDRAVLNGSAYLSSRAAQQLLENHLVKRGGRLGPPDGHQLVLFVDDLNFPNHLTSGAQPPLEMLRLLLDRQGLYDRKSLSWKPVIDTVTVAACGPPGGGRHDMSCRLTRHMTTLAMPQPSTAVMKGICTALLDGFMQRAPFDKGLCAGLVEPLVDGTLAVYSAAREVLLPTMCHVHYSFSFREILRVFQGLLALNPAQSSAAPGAGFTGITQLWCHEVIREFGDRLNNDGDVALLRQLVRQQLLDKLGWQEPSEGSNTSHDSPADAPVHGTGWNPLGAAAQQVVSDSLFEGDNQILFGDIGKIGLTRDQKVYEKLPNIAKLASLLEVYLEEYNICRGRASSAALAAAATSGDGLRRQPAATAAAAAAEVGRGGSQLQLVFFKDAVLHVVRLARVLRRAGGSALLVGVGRSGKQSLARFAAFVADCDAFSIHLRKGYDLPAFREDLKQLHQAAGIEGRHVMLLLTDSHIVDEAMLADVNGLLNTGDITGLFSFDEQSLLLDQLRPWLKLQPDLEEGRAAAWEAFIGRVRDHLHVVMCTSPVGNAFNTRCRQFPALVSCTTIDWYRAWPAEALLGVGIRFMEQLSLTPAGPAATAEASTASQLPHAPATSMAVSVAKLCVHMHQSVELAAEQSYQELRRRCYITPKLYLDLLQQYAVLLAARRIELGDNRRRLLNGIDKLSETNTALDAMQAHLNQLKPQLAEKTAATSALLEQAAVMPAFQAAVGALDTLNKADIIEMKTFIKPPALVQLTMEGVCILLQTKTDWDSAKRVLGDATFISRLIDYDKDNISEKIRRELRRIMQDPAFTPDQVGKQSKAAMSLCMWVQAIDTYATVYRIVEPKRLALAAAETALKASNEALAAKRAQLAAGRARVAALQQQLAETQKELDALRREADLCSQRLGRAGQLTSLLADELVRWQAAASDLSDHLGLLVGDALVAAAAVNYLGPFTGAYRSTLLSDWRSACCVHGISLNPDWQLAAVLSTPVELLDWICQGLPADTVSIDNALIATRGSRWPLIIDPQGQASRWIRAHEARQGLVAVRCSDPAVLKQVETAVRLGRPLLLEQAEQGALPPGLEALLMRQVDTHAGRSVVQLGDLDVDYNDKFRLYIISDDPNPNILSETAIKINLVNFALTRQGLEDQLLADLVQAERPDLEESRERLIVSISTDKRELHELENKILGLLRDASGNLLDDESLIAALNSAKAKSGIIQARVQEAQVTECQVNDARSQYRGPPVAVARLWFVISDLAALNATYAASLSSFMGMVKHCIAAAPAAPALQARLDAIESFTYSYIHRTVCRGLFEVHKLLFAFMMSAAKQREEGAVSAPEGLSQAVAAGTNSSTGIHNGASNTCDKTTQDVSMRGRVGSHQLQQQQQEAAEGSIASPADEHSPTMYDSMLTHPAPQQQTGGLSIFQRLVLIKVCRKALFMAAVKEYVGALLGPDFVHPPSACIVDLYRDSSPSTPILFVLAQGADATADLMRFAAAEHGRLVNRGLQVVSLGQGQGPVAEALVHLAMQNGDWVCLQNCHLAKSWMSQLAALVEQMEAAAASADTNQQLHPSFRLWLTTAPVDYLPSILLHKGIRVVQEPPRGFKQALMKGYQCLPRGCLSACSDIGASSISSQTWQQQLFAMAVLHSLVQERRRFGVLGWNSQYAFSDSDFSCAVQSMQMIVQHQAGHGKAMEAPEPCAMQRVVEALRYVVGEVVYGGRVTDANDWRLLTVLVKLYLPWPGRQGPDQEQAQELASTVVSATSIVGLDSMGLMLLQEMSRYNRLLATVRSSLLELQSVISGLMVLSQEAELSLAAVANLKVPEAWAAVAYPCSKPLGGWLTELRRRVDFLQQLLNGGPPTSFWLPGFFFPQSFLTAVLQHHSRKSAVPVDQLGFSHRVISSAVSAEDIKYPAAHGVYIHGLFLEAARWDCVTESLAEAERGAMFSQLPLVQLVPHERQHSSSAGPADDLVPAAKAEDVSAVQGTSVNQLLAGGRHSYACPVYRTAARAGLLNNMGQSIYFLMHVDLPLPAGSMPQHWLLRGVAAVCSVAD
eukprot:gene7079-7292_t